VDVPDRKRRAGKRVQVNNQSIAIFRGESKYYALDSVCSHAGYDISLGDIEDDSGLCVRCPKHKMTFYLETGKLARGRGRFEQKTYQTKVCSDSIWVKA